MGDTHIYGEQQHDTSDLPESLSTGAPIEDMWPPQEDDEEEPDWVKTEREQFVQFRDKNKDGFMDRSEVEDWILPPDYDHTEAEARHLIYESDTDKVCICDV